MFDGAQDHHQFHQFVAPIARTTLPLHLSFATPNNNNSNNTFLPFDPYNPSHQLPLQTNNLFHPLPHHSPTRKHDHQEKEEANTTFSSINVEIQRDQRQLPPPLIDSWTNDEVLALLRIRSSLENWFPQLTWEHVSRKLAELGFKKSAEKCKEKFEDESRNFNYGKNNNYRFLSELEGLYQGADQQNPDPGHHEAVSVTTEKENSRDINNNDIDAPAAVTKQCDKMEMEKSSKDKKRKRRDRFEVFKCFCESVVNNMMAQQEEMHNKLLKDMLKRDEEKLAREEAWKKQEMERMNKELDMMAQEQAIAGDRQAIIIEFLKKYLATSQDFGGANSNSKLTKGSNGNLNSQNPNPSNGENNNLEPTPSTNNVILDHQTTTCTSPPCQNPSSSDTALLQVPSSSNSSPATYNNNNNHHTYSLEDVGRRWPRDEVLALINLRCTSLNSEEKEGNNNNSNNKAPLWERISQGMSEMGYKRSAKRCKEKWENINKYFRKTKDVSKKRSLDSRTCPYFHQLSSLYSQGKLVPQSERLGNHLNQTENSGEMSPDQPQAQSSPVGSGG